MHGFQPHHPLHMNTNVDIIVAHFVKYAFYIANEGHHQIISNHEHIKEGMDHWLFLETTWSLAMFRGGRLKVLF